MKYSFRSCVEGMLYTVRPSNSFVRNYYITFLTWVKETEEDATRSVELYGALWHGLYGNVEMRLSLGMTQLIAQIS